METTEHKHKHVEEASSPEEIQEKINTKVPFIDPQKN